METRSIGSLISRLPSRCSEQLDDGKSERTTVVVRSLFLKVADVLEEKRQKTGKRKWSAGPRDAPETACSKFLIRFQ